MYIKWCKGCPDPENCSAKFTASKFFAYGEDSENELYDQLTNHLYAGTTHKKFKIWKTAKDQVIEFIEEVESAGEKCYEVCEETWAGRGEYRNCQERWTEKLKPKSEGGASSGASRASSAVAASPRPPKHAPPGHRERSRSRRGVDRSRPHTRGANTASASAAKPSGLTIARTRPTERASRQTDALLSTQAADHVLSSNDPEKLIDLMAELQQNAVTEPGMREPMVTIKLSTIVHICDSIGRVRNSADSMVTIAEGLQKQFKHERSVLEKSISHLMQQISVSCDQI